MRKKSKEQLQQPINQAATAQDLLDQHRETIRKQAELMLAYTGADIARMSTEDIQKLLFEFQVHQIELKMQNEEFNRVQQELMLSRDKYLQLYHLSPVAYLTLDRTGLIQKANIAAANLLGYPQEDLVNKRFAELVHPSDQDACYLFINQLIGQKTDQVLNAKIKAGTPPAPPPEYQHFQLCADVQETKGCQLSTYVECYGKTIVNHENKLRILLSITDISERKLAQDTIACLNKKLEEKVRKQNNALTSTNLSLMKKIEELRYSKHQLMEREAKLNSIFNASVEGIITVDLSNTIVSANAAVETIFGYPPEKLTGLNINRLMPSLTTNTATDKATYTGQIQEIEGLHKNGSSVPLDMSTAEFSLDNTHYFTHIVRDVSLRKYQEQQDKEHLDELAHVTRLGLMGEMASGIAHEVNQPLSAISSYTQASLNLIHSKKPDLDKLADILQKTQQQALRAGHIIHRMREFVKSHVKHRSTIDVNKLIHEAIGLCINDLNQSGIKLSFELEDDLPPLYADQIQIEQVLINLVRNSMDALQNLPENQPRQLTIHSHLTHNDNIQVRVKDNGIGLDEAQQQKILTPFYTTKTDGMGMGLSISRSLIEAHEGSLHFNSLPGKGTTFYFTLPLRRKNDER
ncbi:MAG: PAS domain S-box protein [Methylobacter sp.]|nr:PAS domain S-box protein [Methylobacter sp.]MDP3056824.1 PAS domain S-box protein [Methylobacter sp.]MDP3361255.1 PAS domain S-box protein [Methylobacter sp.]MDZ4220907.1 PAS domain S-box protein [Methylobacter sp.]